MAKKNILVKDILEMFDEKSDDLVIVFYAYGIYYASTIADNLITVKEIKDRLRNDCLRAKVFKIEPKGDFENNIEPYIKVLAEMVY